MTFPPRTFFLLILGNVLSGLILVGILYHLRGRWDMLDVERLGQ